MPAYRFVCQQCSKEFSLLQDKFFLPKCADCGGDCKRRLNPPSTSVKEVIDTGAMTKKLERYANATELFRDRARLKDKQRKGE